MNELELKQIVRDVIKDVVKISAAALTPLEPKRSQDEPQKHSQDEKAQATPTQTNQSVNSRRKLANENIARWLGYAPSQRDIKTLLKPLTTVAGGPNPELSKRKTYDEAVLIPNPRRPEKIESYLHATPARIGVWRAGTRYLTKVALKLRADHAVAKDAVIAELPSDLAQKNGWIALQTNAKNKEEFLLRPDLGRQLDEASIQIVKEKGIQKPTVQIIVADGLSSWAAERQGPAMVEELKKLFQQAQISVGSVFLVHYSRIAIQDVIGETLGAQISMILLGERPGLGGGESLSNYIVYNPKVGTVNAKKSMISNIHPSGIPPLEAAQVTVYMVQKMLEQKCSGVELKI